jgi:hypothetical protein
MEKVNQHPLIIVFYLDVEMMKQGNIIQPFAESVNQMLMAKEANALAFFMPTTGEERIECINPVMLKEEDMTKIYKIVDDLKASFLVDIDVADEEVVLDEKPCVCKDGGECNCENKTN